MGDTTGNLARELAAAPPLPSIKSELRDAMRESSVESAAKLSKKVKGKNPFTLLLGEPTFSLGERKWYADKGWGGKPGDPNKTNMRLARAAFRPIENGPTIEFSIYLDQTVVKRADGTYAESVTRCSMPKGLVIDKKDTVALLAKDAFTESIIDQYEAWVLTIDQSQPVVVNKEVGKHVKVVRISD